MSMQVKKTDHSPQAVGTGSTNPKDKGAHPSQSTQPNSLLDAKAPGDKVDLSTRALMAQPAEGKGGSKTEKKETEKDNAAEKQGNGKKKSSDLPDGNPWKATLKAQEKTDAAKAKQQPSDSAKPATSSQSAGTAASTDSSQQAPSPAQFARMLQTPSGSKADKTAAGDASPTTTGAASQPDSLFQPASVGAPDQTNIMPMGDFVQDFVSDQMTVDPLTEQSTDQRTASADQAEQAATVQSTQAQLAQQAADAAAALAALAMKIFMPQSVSPSGDVSDPKAQTVLNNADLAKRNAFTKSLEAIDSVRVASEKASQAKASTQISSQMSMYR